MREKLNIKSVFSIFRDCEKEVDKPRCKLLGIEQNAFAVISKVKATLKESGQREEAKKFLERAFSTCVSYTDVLQLALEYVEIE